MSEIVLLKDLKRPHEAVSYLWAPKGDMALARCTPSIERALRRAVSDGRDTFRWALPPKYRTDEARNETEMTVSTLTFRVERFRHGGYPGDFWAARFASSEDVQRFMEEYPKATL